jgi:PDZ domain-containing protein
MDPGDRPSTTHGCSSRYISVTPSRTCSRIVFAIAAALAAPAQAQHGAVLPGIEGATIDASIPARVPLKLLDGARPTVHAMINGRGPFVFGIETGGTFGAIIDTRVANQLALSPGESPGTIRVDSIKIGTLAIRRLTAAVRPGTGVPGTDGLIGIAALRQLVVTLDYPAGEAIFARDTLGSVDARITLPLRRTGPLVGVDAAFAGEPILLTVDTQGGTAAACQPEVANRLRLTGKKVVVGQARVGGINAAPVDAYAARLDGNVTFGAITIQRPIISFIPLPAEIVCVVGVDLLGRFSVSIDQRSMRIRFASSNPTVGPPPSLYSTGLGLIPEADGMRVVAVPSGSPAELAGVKPGDQLLQVNGAAASLTTASPTAIRALAGSGKPILLKFRRGTSVVDAVLTPRLVVP